MSDPDPAFVRETREGIDALNDGLVDLEMGLGGDVDELFRVAHTLKGNCSAAGYDGAADLAHALEALLEGIRADDVDPDPAAMDAAFEAVDGLSATVDAIDRGEDPPSGGEAADELRRVLSERTDRVDPPGEVPDPGSDPDPGAAGATDDPGGPDGRTDDPDGPGGATDDPVGADGADDPTGGDGTGDPPDLDDVAPPDPDGAGEDVSVEEALDRASAFDDLEGLAERVDDAGEFADLDGAGTFDELVGGDDTARPDPGTASDVDAAAPTDADPGQSPGEGPASPGPDPASPGTTAGESPPAGAGTDESPGSEETGDDPLGGEGDGADEAFADLRGSVDPAAPDRLESELAAVSFGDVDPDEELGIDELVELDPAAESGREDAPTGTAGGPGADEDRTTGTAGRRGTDEDRTTGAPGTADREPAGTAGSGPDGSESALEGSTNQSTGSTSDGDAPDGASETGPEWTTVPGPGSGTAESGADPGAVPPDPGQDAGTAPLDPDDGTDDHPVPPDDSGNEESVVEAIRSLPADDWITPDEATDDRADKGKPDETTGDQGADETADEGRPDETTGDQGADGTADEERPDETADDERSGRTADDGDETDDVTGDAEAWIDPPGGDAGAPPGDVGDPPGSGVSPMDEPESGVSPTDEPESGGSPTDEPESGGSTTDEPESGGSTTDEPGTSDRSTGEPGTGSPATDDQGIAPANDEGSPGSSGDDGLPADSFPEGKVEGFDRDSATAEFAASFREEFGDQGAGEDEPRAVATTVDAALGEDGTATESGNESGGTIPLSAADADELLGVSERLLTTHTRLDRAYDGGDPAVEEALAELREVAADLEERVTSVRLVPVEEAFGGLSRAARDAAREGGAEVRLETAGGDVELDRAIVDALSDALVHLVRNAVDHGIEPPAEREVVGKPPRGTVTVTAERGTDGVVVEVSDDGRGIDRDAVRETAVERGLVSESEAAAMDPPDVADLLLRPGFTTRESVSAVSGRGVGLDAVATTVREFDGDVAVESDPGEGTTVRLTLPVSVAAEEVLFVTVGGEEYAVPAGEVARVEEGDRARVDDGEFLVPRPLDGQDGGTDEPGDDEPDDRVAVDPPAAGPPEGGDPGSIARGAGDRGTTTGTGDRETTTGTGDRGTTPGPGGEPSGATSHGGDPAVTSHGGDPAAATAAGAVATESTPVEYDRYPVVDLASAFSVPGGADGPGVYVRIREDVRPVVLRVDDVGEWRKAVVAPYEDLFGDVPGIGGATVLGGGRVVNTVDVTTVGGDPA